MDATAPPPRLRLTGITKRYASVVANSGIDLTVAPGEIHALLGENGAGKSTLVKIIYGVVQPDEGEIAWEGRAGPHRRPECRARARHRHGVPAFLLFESADGDREHRARPRRARAASANSPRRIAEIRARYGLALDPVAACAPPLGRRAAARRDRALPAAGAEAADHGRADLGADAAGGGGPVRRAAPAGRRGLQHPLHQPQARGDQGAVRARDGAARRARGRRLRPAHASTEQRWPS